MATDLFEKILLNDARLAALDAYAVLDTPEETGFDDVVFMASQICETPVALVSLVERDRQWFKARVGFEACETPIEQSVCAHALGQTELLIIPDLTADHRTSTNTLVTEDPHIRFYAGAPLVTPQGEIIGTLCVIDTVVRPQGLTPIQASILQKLAAQVIVQLELRKAYRELNHAAAAREAENVLLRDHTERSRRAEEAGRIGTFEIEIATSTIQASPEFCRLFGLPVAATYPAAEVETLIVARDANLHSTDATRTDGTAVMDVEYRIRRLDDGRLRWIARRGQFILDESGKPRKMFGAVRDITERKTLQVQQVALLAVGEILRSTTDIDAITRGAAEILGQSLSAIRAGFGAVNALTETVTIHADWTEPQARSLAGSLTFSDYGLHFGDLRAGQVVAVSDTATDLRTSPTFAALADIGVRSFVDCPIMDRDKLIAVAFVHFAEPRNFTPGEIDFIRGVADRTQAAIAQRQAERDQQILNNEISHRLKNTLSMVQAVANQTLRTVKDRGPVDAFEQRLQALGTAHDVLMQDNWTASPMRTAVQSVLKNFDTNQRISISGPDLQLGSRAILSLSLLLHELTTNAVKYGALSNDEGRVSVTWQLIGEEQNTDIVLDWREAGGPSVREPERKGFGSRLIGMGLDGTGGVELHYDPEGFAARIRAPLSHLQQQ